MNRPSTDSVWKVTTQFTSRSFLEMMTAPSTCLGIFDKKLSWSLFAHNSLTGTEKKIRNIFKYLFKSMAKIYLYGPQFLGQSTTPALHRFLQQKRSRLSFKLCFCGPDFYTCLSNKYNFLWSRVLHLCISRTIWLVFRGSHNFSNVINISHLLGDDKTQGCGPGLG